MLSELRAQRDHIEEAIIVLERLAASGGRRRGRPPKWMARATAQVGATVELTRERKPFSAATRARMAASQQKRRAAARVQK